MAPLEWQNLLAGIGDHEDSNAPYYLLGVSPRSNGNGDFKTAGILVVSFLMVRREMTLTILLWEEW